MVITINCWCFSFFNLFVKLSTIYLHLHFNLYVALIILLRFLLYTRICFFVLFHLFFIFNIFYFLFSSLPYTSLSRQKNSVVVAHENSIECRLLLEEVVGLCWSSVQISRNFFNTFFKGSKPLLLLLPRRLSKIILRPPTTGNWLEYVYIFFYKNFNIHFSPRDVELPTCCHNGDRMKSERIKWVACTLMPEILLQPSATAGNHK